MECVCVCACVPVQPWAPSLWSTLEWELFLRLCYTEWFPLPMPATSISLILTRADFLGFGPGPGVGVGVGKGLQGPASMVGAPKFGLHGSGAKVGPPPGKDIVMKAAASISAP